MRVPEDKICDCGKQFVATHFLDLYCQECEVRIEQERVALEAEREQRTILEGQKDAARAVLRDTPPRYQATDIGHRAFNRELWAKVNRWQPTADQPWLGLIGASGACKTRCAFLKLSQLVSAHVTCRASRAITPRFEIATACELHAAVTGQYSDDRQAKADARDFLDRIQSCDFLLFDDFGKARNTPAYSSALFGIIDHRHAHNAVTIWTANSTPEQLVAGMGEDMAGPLAGRIIECSTIITCQ